MVGPRLGYWVLAVGVGVLLKASCDVLMVVQARMGSTRLPGKVLVPFGGTTPLGLLLDRLEFGLLTLNNADTPTGQLSMSTVVATSDVPGDDQIATFCRARGTTVVRGSEGDVLARFAAAVDRCPSSHVIRITADCPLTDPQIVRDTLLMHLETESDYTSNVFPRTFPKGLDVEVIRTDALLAASRDAVDHREREHVTPYFYRHPERFKLANLRSGGDFGDERWTLDTPADLQILQTMLDDVDEDPVRVGWQHVLEVVGVKADRGSLRLRPATEDDREQLLEWRNDAESVRYSVSGRSVAALEHETWLSAVLVDPAVDLRLIEVDSEAVGMVRVDTRDAAGRISIVIDDRFRGSGIALRALRELTQTGGSHAMLDKLVAEVNRENLASTRLFTSAGFRLTGSIGDFDTYVFDMERQ